LGICQLNRQLKSALEITVILDLTLLQYELQFTPEKNKTLFA
jgi:hypothetical protein